VCQGGEGRKGPSGGFCLGVEREGVGREGGGFHVAPLHKKTLEKEIQEPRDQDRGKTLEPDEPCVEANAIKKEQGFKKREVHSLRITVKKHEHIKERGLRKEKLWRIIRV